MTEHTVNVTSKREERLPDWASEYAAIICWMRQEEMLEEIARRLRVPRSGGYSDVDDAASHIAVSWLAWLTAKIWPLPHRSPVTTIRRR